MLVPGTRDELACPYFACFFFPQSSSGHPARFSCVPLLLASTVLFPGSDRTVRIEPTHALGSSETCQRDISRSPLSGIKQIPATLLMPMRPSLGTDGEVDGEWKGLSAGRVLPPPVQAHFPNKAIWWLWGPMAGTAVNSRNRNRERDVSSRGRQSVECG